MPVISVTNPWDVKGKLQPYSPTLNLAKKGSSGTNTLAYLSGASLWRGKKFYIIDVRLKKLSADLSERLLVIISFQAKPRRKVVMDVTQKLPSQLTPRACAINLFTSVIEEHVLDTNAGKQVSSAATDVQLTLVLKKWTTFKYRSRVLTIKCL